jgi:Short C-terminal domain
MFRIGLSELIIICGIILFFFFIAWATARRASRRPNLPPPGGPFIDAVDSSATGRLKELNRLLENDLITQAEYDEKKAEILKQL